jgi:hypothetical protein
MEKSKLKTDNHAGRQIWHRPFRPWLSFSQAFSWKKFVRLCSIGCGDGLLAKKFSLRLKRGMRMIPKHEWRPRVAKIIYEKHFVARVQSSA